MSIETIRQSVMTEKIIATQTSNFNIETDIIVPDNKPDVIRIIKSESSVFLTKKDILDGKIRLEGNIVTYLIYMSADSDNNVRGISNTYNFNETIDIPNIKQNMSLELKLSTIDSIANVLNERKVNVKVSVEINYKIYENLDIELLNGLSENSDIQTLKNDVTISTIVGQNSQKIIDKEDIAIPENNADIFEILKITHEINNTDVRVSYSKLLTKGDLSLKVLYVTNTEKKSINTFTVAIPFTGLIEIPGMNDSMKYQINYDVKNLYIKPYSPDDSNGTFYVEFEIEATAKVYEQKSMQIISDLYSPNSIIQSNSKQIVIEQNTTSKTDTIVLRHSMPASTINGVIYDSTIKPTITSVNLSTDKVLINGTARVEILFYDSEQQRMNTKFEDIEFEQNIGIKNINTNSKIDTILSVQSVDITNSNIDIDIRVSINATINVFDSINLLVIDNIVELNEMPKNLDSIVIYYVQKNDNLWKIAKRYQTTVEKIIQSNMLENMDYTKSLPVGLKLYIIR